MAGAPHHLVLTEGPSHKLEMASAIGDLLPKIDALTAALQAAGPVPPTQLTALGAIRSSAAALDAMLDSRAPGPGPDSPSNSPAASALVAALEAYGAQYSAADIDILFDANTPIRQSPGYQCLSRLGLAVDFETRILAQPANFPKPRIIAILSKIATFEADPRFVAKVQKAIQSNRFWSPNMGAFFELADLATLDNLRFFDVAVGGKVIDVLQGDGTLIDQKTQINLDLRDPARPVLSSSVTNQLTAMRGAIGTVIEGITITSCRFHVEGGVSADVQAVLVRDGLVPFFMAR